MIEALVERHAEEAGFLWHLRCGAAKAPHYDLDDLVVLDERVEAHVDGLRIAGDDGWKSCEALLSEMDAPAAFVATHIAMDRGDLRGFAKVLDAFGEAPEMERGIVSALGFLPFEQVARILPGLFDPRCPPSLQRIGIAACAIHRRDPGEALARAIYSDDGGLRARALRAVGELARRDLGPALRSELQSSNDDTRFEAAWSLALLGDTDAAHLLLTLAGNGHPQGERAVQVGIRRVDARTAMNWLPAISDDPTTRRISIVARGALGRPEVVPALLAYMKEPPLARVALEAFVLITGMNVEAAPLRGVAPEGFRAGPSDEAEDEDVAPDPDEHLPWPATPALEHAWAHQRKGFSPEGRYLLGKPISPAWLDHVLRSGYQRQRAAAALERCMASPGNPLFEVRAPALRQRQAVG